MQHKDSSEPEVVHVDLGSRSYPIVIGGGVKAQVADHLPERAKRVAVVTQENIGIEVDSGLDQQVFYIGDGEHAKVPDTITALCCAWAEWGLTRNDVVVGVGGGIVTDVAGFAASAYHRGVDVIHVPTSLLAQIDAAIGGKTGVNLPQGKNLMGAYWQPKAVLCDTETLASLPERHYRAGLGELAKYHFLGGVPLDDLSIDDQVLASAKIKAKAVMEDEREGSSRALLNYGHTLGHALETALDHEVLHGEAVAIGIVYAAEVARLMGRIGDAEVAEHHRVISGYDLATQPPASLDFASISPLFSRDKKALESITFILDGSNGPEVVTEVDLAILEEAYELLQR